MANSEPTIIQSVNFKRQRQRHSVTWAVSSRPDPSYRHPRYNSLITRGLAFTRSIYF